MDTDGNMSAKNGLKQKFERNLVEFKGTTPGSKL